MKLCTPSLTLAESRHCRLCSPSLGKPWAAALTRQCRSVWWASSTTTVHRWGSFKVYLTLLAVHRVPIQWWLMYASCLWVIYRTSIIRWLSCLLKPGQPMRWCFRIWSRQTQRKHSRPAPWLRRWKLALETCSQRNRNTVRSTKEQIYTIFIQENFKICLGFFSLSKNLEQNLRAGSQQSTPELWETAELHALGKWMHWKHQRRGELTVLKPSVPHKWATFADNHF